jgi:hypothetical protein
MDTESRTKEPSVTRRNLLKTGAAGALGAAAATAITATPASADDGDLLILGQENFALSPTKITNPDSTDDLVFGGGFLSVARSFGGAVISAFTTSGPAVSVYGGFAGVMASGPRGFGVFGDSSDGSGVRGRSLIGTGVKAEATVLQEGTAFEAVGPVKVLDL